NQNCIALVDVVDQSIVVDIRRVGFFALGSADGEFEDVARFEMQFSLEVAGENGWAVRVHENGDGAAKFLRDSANSRDDLPHPIMLRMTHVEPEYIRASLHQLPQRFRFLGRWAERANDFRLAYRSVRFSYCGFIFPPGRKGKIITARIKCNTDCAA